MEDEMYEKDETRIASSQMADSILGNLSRYQKILTEEKDKLKEAFPDEAILDSLFDGISGRIINLCPMVLCDRMCIDILGREAPDNLLAGIGLLMYPISTHDDLADEFPQHRLTAAGLVYSGDISALAGTKILIDNGYANVMAGIIGDICINHYYQTLIINSLWRCSTDEAGYMKAISHTKYWAAIGLRAAIIYSQRSDLHNFVYEFADYYGTVCQLFDDMREIDDDLENGYWSLPIILAKNNNWDLLTPAGKNESIKRSRVLANERLNQAKKICDNFPQLADLVQRIGTAGSTIGY